MNVDKRFALIDSDGYRRYPYLSQNGSGGYGFVIGRSANSRHTASIEEVIQAVVMDGESMRAKALEGPHANQGNSLKLHAKRKIVGFYVAPELVYLVEGSPANVARIPGDDGPQTSDTQTVVERLNHLKVSDVQAAIRELQAFITPSLREVLELHAGSPDHRGRIADLAHNIDASREEEIRSIYEAFSLAIADKLGISGTTGLETLAFGNDAGQDSVWVLRPQVLAALKETGTIESDELPAPASGALTDDPLFLSATPTVRRALVNARVGQGGYRKRMLALWGNRCAVTGCKVEKALIASHAKAWSVSTNEERLDEFNGLLLSASLDRLFDAGLIAFADDGRLLCAPTLDNNDLPTLGLLPGSALRQIHPRHVPYLGAHRRQFGFE